MRVHLSSIPLRLAAASLCLSLAVPGWAGAEEARGPTVALMGATLHTVSGEPIPRGTLLMEGATIRKVGRDFLVPPGVEVVDVSGLHIYPSLIAAETVLGLTEIGSVRGTVDTTEVGRIHPQIRAEVAVNPDSELLPVARSNGVLLAGIAPRGGLISGTSAVLALEGWTWEDMTRRAPAGLYVSWPRMRIRRGPDVKPPVKKQEEQRERRLEELREAFRQARAWWRARDAMEEPGVPRHENDVRWEAMGPALRGEIPVFVRARSLHQIRAALDWAEEEGIDIVLTGASDAWRLAEELAEREIPVILDPVLALPRRGHEPYDTAYRAASRLQDAGVKLCISTAWASNTRNLPYGAAMAAAFGLPPREALRSITLNCAEILGVDERYGSLEPGKSATFIVTDGDPLEITTNVHRAYLDGRPVDLDDRHKGLYRRYKERPRPDVLGPSELEAAPGVE